MIRPFELVRETAPGAGAIAVVRLRGPGALAALRRVAPRFAAGPVGEVRLVRLASEGAALDEALVVVRGESWFELHLHGGRGAVAAIERALGGPGAPLEPVSVEERAERAAADVASALVARVLVDQAEGALRRGLARLAAAEPATWRRGLLALEARGRRFVELASVPRVVLAGPTNAGKSTLFNVLVGERGALVSPEPGTTRDLVRRRVPLGAFAIELVDTAGERASPDELERAGQDAARDARAGASLVLWLSPRDRPVPPPTSRVRTVVVESRADAEPVARPGAPRPAVGIAALAEPGLARAAIHALLVRELDLDEAAWPRGAAVAFDADLVAAIAGAATDQRLAARDRRAAFLARLLGAPGRPWWIDPPECRP